MKSHTLTKHLPIFSGRARLITHIAGWLLVFFTFFYLISGVRSTSEALARTCLNVLFLMALFYGNAKLIINRYVETGRVRERLWLWLTLWLSASVLRAWMEIHLFGSSVFDRDAAHPTGMVKLTMVYALSFFLLLLFSSLYQLVENRRALELQHLELESKHTEAQLNYLKAQINPHFLFNTLNNIYAAATLQHPRTADMVLRLSELLRYVTYDAQANQVPLEKEIAQIRAYIDLFQLKSETPLPVQVDIIGDPIPYIIEPVLLLPMVENALKHGDLELNPAGFLNVKVDIRPATLHFVVTNSFDPQNRQKDAVGGVGLENVRQRLALNYPGKHRFDLSTDDRVFTADLELSLTTA